MILNPVQYDLLLFCYKDFPVLLINVPRLLWKEVCYHTCSRCITFIIHITRCYYNHIVEFNTYKSCIELFLSYCSVQTKRVKCYCIIHHVQNVTVLASYNKSHVLVCHVFQQVCYRATSSLSNKTH